MRKTSLNCTSDGFMKLSGIKLPDARYSWNSRNISLEECQNLCLKNCSCMATSNMDIIDGSNCLLWSTDLLDIEVTPENTQQIYVRMAPLALIFRTHVSGTRKKEGHRSKLIVSLVVVVALLLCLSLALYAGRRKKNPMLKREEKRRGHRNEENDVTGNHMEAFELPVFDLLAIANAINNFSIKNKLGEGGFGPVYKIQTNAASLIESTGHIFSGYINYCPSHEHDRTPRCCSCEKSGAKGR